MGSREPKHLSCPTHGAVWGTIYKDGAVDYDCGCHAAPTPPAPADDAGGAEAMREACARRVEKAYLDRPAYNHGDSPEWVASNETRRIAAAIRALPLPPATGDVTRVPASHEEAASGAVCAEERAVHDLLNREYKRAQEDFRRRMADVASEPLSRDLILKMPIHGRAALRGTNRPEAAKGGE